ncbi:MAG: hypothetical protein CMF35_10585 [Leeuwenhoekiella sp.]|uniref:Uncharacterized protein n=1 Tax=Leeuwenhoekiella blandensis (strain CECT 7118 / CCUG 51940 / KCTC 22103 / MED217) TaxID=398720 RepID=A3XLR6_LEEBM|nr:hypothetical protein MED217_11624 [Leeuwenhoekiella blandensis MED217]MAO44379.1 hypothetical protein [Leeuwenhoekiella sp.]MBQ52113.1 hypothetical protein [Leeuwenhoekiella sp.]HBT10963.1 hypothetical protein [Leeuwenhoekiella sp.]HCW65122.1 hypothetical protein [Leeuwenhoekiella sp.]
MLHVNKSLKLIISVYFTFPNVSKDISIKQIYFKEILNIVYIFSVFGNSISIFIIVLLTFILFLPLNHIFTFIL